MNVSAGKTTFDGVLRLEITPSSIIHGLQAKIAKSIPGQLPVVDRYMHLTLVGIQHLKPYKTAFKSAILPAFAGSLEFEDQPRMAELGETKSTFVYANGATQHKLFEYVKSILEPLSIPLENDRKFHLSLTNLTGFGPNNVGPVWQHDKPIPELQKGATMISVAQTIRNVVRRLADEDRRGWGWADMVKKVIQEFESLAWSAKYVSGVFQVKMKYPQNEIKDVNTLGYILKYLMDDMEILKDITKLQNLKMFVRVPGIEDKEKGKILNTLKPVMPGTITKTEMPENPAWEFGEATYDVVVHSTVNATSVGDILKRIDRIESVAGDESIIGALSFEMLFPEDSVLLEKFRKV